MGSCGSLFCLPVGALLKVENFITQIVACLIFRVGVLCLPRFTAQTLAIGTLQLQFGNSYTVSLFLGGEAFDSQIATFLRRMELDCLPTVACLEGACGYGCSAV